CYEKALALRKKRAEMLPDLPEAKEDIAEEYGLLGNLALKTGDPRAAQGHYRNSLRYYNALPKELLRPYPMRQKLAALAQRLGMTSLQVGDLEEAQRGYQAALKEREELVRLTRNTRIALGPRRDYAYSLIDLGDIELTWRDDPARALSFYHPAAR